MPYKDKEYAKQRAKERREQNPELYKQRSKEEYERNKEQYKKHNKKYRELNKDKLNEYNREYSKTYDQTSAIKKYHSSDKGIKALKKSKWKQRNVDISDFDILYERYIKCSKCDFCKKDITKYKALEHNHYSMEVRGIVCRGCNNKMASKDKKFKKVMEQLKNAIYI
tara:strand:- start:9618 stop:10118 length:501 start_codon:yes stop_codon:yes gene_type:complete